MFKVNNKTPERRQVKHTQTIRRQFAYELFECVLPDVVLVFYC